ncbi:MAG TPA: hypothetical protein VNO70_10315 [Blastocatellia bacterium]|nr:hypothetical protein [Blastocatellia bacterium]
MGSIPTIPIETASRRQKDETPMNIKTVVIATAALFLLAVPAAAQESSPPGFTISLKNGSSVRGRTLARDEATGKLRLTMTESATGEPKSYAMIAMDDAETISASTADTDSIRIRLYGGSELRCKEFNLNGDLIAVKIGTASRVELRWDQIESIAFGR